MSIILDQPVPVDAVVWEFLDAFANILRNAADSMREQGGGTLSVTVVPATEADGQWVTIRAHNTGLKIIQYVLDHMFEAFFSTKEEGTGYGMWRAQQVIHDHGARENPRTTIIHPRMAYPLLFVFLSRPRNKCSEGDVLRSNNMTHYSL